MLFSKAYQLVKTVIVTDSNYAAAWERLKNRYKNPRAII